MILYTVGIVGMTLCTEWMITDILKFGWIAECLVYVLAIIIEIACIIVGIMLKV